MPAILGVIFLSRMRIIGSKGRSQPSGYRYAGDNVIAGGLSKKYLLIRDSSCQIGIIWFVASLSTHEQIVVQSFKYTLYIHQKPLQRNNIDLLPLGYRQ